MKFELKELPEAVPYFRQFMSANHDEFFNHMREYRTYPEGGYASFYRDNEVMQVMINIYHNLYEGFGNLEIPQDFPSPQALIETWQRFRDFLVQDEKLFEDVYNKLKPSKDTSKDVQFPVVLLEIDKERRKVISALDYVLSMDDVKKYSAEPKIQEKDAGEAKTQKKKTAVKEETATVPDIIRSNPQEDNAPKLNLIRVPQEQYDIVVVTAIYKEFKAFSVLLENGKKKQVPDPSRTIYHEGIITLSGGKTIKVLLACAHQMGMVAAASLITKMIYVFQPKVVAMCGIAAGINGNVGDIMIPDILWDYGSGKYSYPEKKKSKKKLAEDFQPYRYPKEINPPLIGELIRLSKERNHLDKIKREYLSASESFDEMATNLSVHVGPFASGAAVVANDKILEQIKKQDGKLIGFDMEAYGVVYAAMTSNVNPTPIPLIMKSISDFGNRNKGHKDKDKHQAYAAYTSARYLHWIIQEQSSLLNL